MVVFLFEKPCFLFLVENSESTWTNSGSCSVFKFHDDYFFGDVLANHVCVGGDIITQVRTIVIECCTQNACRLPHLKYHRITTFSSIISDVSIFWKKTRKLKEIRSLL